MIGFRNIFSQRIPVIIGLLVLIVFLGALFRFVNLGEKSLWYDESLTW
jgi:predicted membrane-bound mannosyltransferase